MVIRTLLDRVPFLPQSSQIQYWITPPSGSRFAADLDSNQAASHETRDMVAAKPKDFQYLYDNLFSNQFIYCNIKKYANSNVYLVLLIQKTN